MCESVAPGILLLMGHAGHSVARHAMDQITLGLAKEVLRAERPSAFERAQ